MQYESPLSTRLKVMVKAKKFFFFKIFKSNSTSTFVIVCYTICSLMVLATLGKSMQQNVRNTYVIQFSLNA